MKQVAFLVLFSGLIASAQVVVQPATSGSIQKMIRSIVGDGVKISNIRYSDTLSALGSFTDINSGIGIKKGFILSTGHVIYAEGPNDNPGAGDSSGDFNLPGDINLEDLYSLINGSKTSDAAFVEFDMLPAIDQINIRYVYASEDYNSQIFLASPSNPFQPLDLMGIFLSVSGISGYKNISTLPGTNTYIASNNIHGGNKNNFCVTPSYASDGLNFNYYIFNPCYSIGNQYNGRTVLLETNVKVIPCKSYKMKIAIADFLGGQYNSSAFIEKGSLGKPLILANNQDADTLIELCQSSNKPILKASKNGSIYQWYLNDQPTTITSQSLTIAGSGEYKVVTTVSPGCLWTDSVQVTVGNDFLVNITPHDTLLCARGTVDLHAISSVPDSVYTYTWHGDSPLSNDTIASPETMPTTTSNYMVTLKSRQGCSVSDTSRIRVNKVLYSLNSTTLSPVICKDNEAIIFSGYQDNQCQTYRISTVNFNFEQPSTFTGETLSYDDLKNNIPIGFDFMFYCNHYTSLNASSNSNVQFGQSSLSNTVSEIPSFLAPNNMIALALSNEDPNDVTNFNYATIGIAQSRVFILTYNKILFHSGFEDSINVQLKLFEGSNAIEIHTLKIRNQYLLNTITQGIENSDGTQGIPIPGKNSMNFEIAHEAWRFELENDNVTKTWYYLSGNPLPDNGSDTLKITLSTPTGFVFKTTASGGCNLSDTVNVSVVNPTFTALPDTTICIGEKVNIRASGADRYLWNGISSISGFIAKPTQSTVYSVTGFFNVPLNCKVYNKVSVTVNPLPIITRTPDTAICKGTEVKLLAKGGVVAWKDSTAATSFIPIHSQTFPFKITDLNNCISRDSIKLVVNDVPNLKVSSDTLICFGDFVKLQASGGDSYLWTPSEGLDKTNTPTVSASPSTSISYLIKAMNSAGCVNFDSVKVLVHKIPEQNFIVSTSPFICDLNNVTATLSGPEGYKYLWLPSGVQTQTFKTAIEGLYTLKISDNECTVQDTIQIAYDCYGIYIIPNVFTPNNDNVNEAFEIKGLEINSILRIFNRFGKTVYETPSYDNNWNAANLPDGIYYYTIEMGRSKQHLKGWVQVIR